MDILAFCRKRRIATDGFRIRQVVDWNRKLTDQSKVMLNIELPPNFPEKYETAIRKAVDNCLVARLGKGLNENSFESSIQR
jgi:ribosomal protein S12 methylthiotransferase accessory factor